MSKENSNSAKKSPVDVTVNKAMEGDQDAFGQLYSEMSGTLKAMLFVEWGQKLTKLEARSDIAQDCFTKAWKNRSQLKDRSRKGFQNWLIAIAQRHLCDRGRILSRPTNNCLALDGDTGNEFQVPEPEKSTGVQRRVERLWNALNRIDDPKLREAVRLNKLEKWPVKKIAERMDTTTSTVYGYLRRGKTQLRRILLGEEGSQNES